MEKFNEVNEVNLMRYYFKSKIKKDERSKRVIKFSIALAKRAFVKKKNNLTSNM